MPPRPGADPRSPVGTKRPGPCFLARSAPRQQVPLRKLLTAAGHVRVDDEGHTAARSGNSRSTSDRNHPRSGHFFARDRSNSGSLTTMPSCQLPRPERRPVGGDRLGHRCRTQGRDTEIPHSVRTIPRRDILQLPLVAKAAVEHDEDGAGHVLADLAGGTPEDA